MADNTMIITGNLTEPATLSYTPNGVAVTNGTIASTPRRFDKQRNEWVDEPTLFLRFTCWRQLAENVSQTLDTKGLPVIATGQVKSRVFEDKQGNQRVSWELDAETLGPDLRYSAGAVHRVKKGDRQTSGGFGGGAANTYDATQNTGWGQPAQPTSGQGWPADEPNF